ncbi:methyltransferase-like protein 23 [Gigantopelta aegis]|uniref:methyltransferase-like protein 23 n=1 Tax=Gigantopelta aegis TaxID=1735272 RepID=UPI001B88BBAD|nr:methyltransferase-like protein 23 [Gigantopelta aegis]
MYIWPSAPVLAQYIWNKRSFVRNKNVLELGAGTSLPGTVAAKCGAKVTLSDASRYPDCLQNCRKSCQMNGLADVNIVGLTWGEFTPTLLELPPLDIILGSDCFFDTKDFEDIIVTVSFLLDKSPHAEFWSTYQERSADRSVEDLLLKWGLRCVHVPLSSFDADVEVTHNHTVHMLVITRKSGVT